MPTWNPERWFVLDWNHTWNTCSPSAIFVFLLWTTLECLVCENLRARYFIKDRKKRIPPDLMQKTQQGHRNCLTSWSLISVPTCPHHCSALTGLSCSEIDFTGSVAVTWTSQGPCSFISVSDIEMYSQTLPFTFFITNLPAKRTPPPRKVNQINVAWAGVTLFLGVGMQSGPKTKLNLVRKCYQCHFFLSFLQKWFSFREVTHNPKFEETDSTYFIYKCIINTQWYKQTSHDSRKLLSIYYSPFHFIFNNYDGTRDVTLFHLPWVVFSQYTN